MGIRDGNQGLKREAAEERDLILKLPIFFSRSSRRISPSMLRKYFSSIRGELKFLT